MSKRFWTVLLSIVFIAGGVLSVFLYLQTDREGPEISMPSEQTTYRASDDSSVLLQGVTAIDSKDGDVSNTLIVEAIYPSADETKAKVVYAAMDTSNNVSKEQRLVDYIGVETEVPESETETEEAVQASAPVTEAEPETESETEPTYYDVNVAVINGSGVAGAAAGWQQYLTGEGYQNVAVGTYSSTVTETVIYSRNQALIETMQQYFPNAVPGGITPTENIDIDLSRTDVIIVIGGADAAAPVNAG